MLLPIKISRIISAKDQWTEVLACAENPDIRIIISNTTEAGLQLSPDDNPHDAPPVSFPAKLLAVLFRRYVHTNGNSDSGFVILPTELVPGNGDLLKQFVLQLADKFFAGQTGFVQWIINCNTFCNTLVDRIVPGALPETQHRLMEEQLGYSDDLMIMSESYSLWAIERQDERIDELLSFASPNPGIVICKNIFKYLELKLRLLNGTHTMVCGLAMKCGFETVKEAMANSEFSHFVKALAEEEFAPCVTGDAINIEEAVSTIFLDIRANQ